MHYHMNPRYWYDRPYDAGIDPDFDDIDGQLSLAQWRDPVLTWQEMWNPKDAHGGDPLLHAQRIKDGIAKRRRKLAYLSYQLNLYAQSTVTNKRNELRKLKQRFKEIKKNPAKPKPPPFFKPFKYHHIIHGYAMVFKCEYCIPYNGHHTPEYWGTGQKDIW